MSMCILDTLTIPPDFSTKMKNVLQSKRTLFVQQQTDLRQKVKRSYTYVKNAKKIHL